MVLALLLGARRDEIEGEAAWAAAGIDVELEPIGLAEREGAVIGEQIEIVIILPDGGECEPLLAPRQIGFAERHLARRRLQGWQERSRLRPVDERGMRRIDHGVRYDEARQLRARCRLRRGVDLRQAAIDGAECADQLLIGTVADVDEARIVVLGLAAPPQPAIRTLE